MHIRNIGKEYLVISLHHKHGEELQLAGGEDKGVDVVV